MNYKWLRAGHVRQEGDTQRRILLSTDIKCYNGAWPDTRLPLAETYYDQWEPVSLVGEPILRSDLMHLQFRRPC